MSMTISIGALPIEAHNNVDSEPKIYSTRKLYCFVPYGANDGEWVKYYFIALDCVVHFEMS